MFFKIIMPVIKKIIIVKKKLILAYPTVYKVCVALSYIPGKYLIIIIFFIVVFIRFCIKFLTESRFSVQRYKLKNLITVWLIILFILILSTICFTTGLNDDYLFFWLYTIFIILVFLIF